MTAGDARLDAIEDRLAEVESKTVHNAKFGDILRTGWCTYYFGADNNWHNARTGEVIEDLDALEDERLAEDEVSEWLTPHAPADVAFLLAELREAREAREALTRVEAECRYLDTLADGDRYYAKVIRAAVAAANGDGQ